MSENLSSREVAIKNLQRFLAWIHERDAASDWWEYVHRYKLNRTEIARECRFALSVLRQNPAIKEALAALESRLEASGVLPAEPPLGGEDAKGVSSIVYGERILAAKVEAERRAKKLEEQNAALQAKIQELRKQVRLLKLIHDHLCRTGRLLQP